LAGCQRGNVQILSGWRSQSTAPNQPGDAGTGSAQGNTQGGSGNDEVTDVDFEEVKDDKNKLNSNAIPKSSFITLKELFFVLLRKIIF